ncbi:MAG: MMPL family transporter [Saprospiraceae bacterium]|nr:MMPL family transporter [Saprospiraceae bacterium]
MFIKYRTAIISIFVLFAIISGYYTTQLKFGFSFEQFFPKGDPDLEFYKNFAKDFESDDSFLLIGIENKPTVFDSSFLSRFHELSLELRNIDYITKVQSLTMIESPVRTPFGISTIPLIHMDNPSYYEQDKKTVTQDARFVYNLIDSNATSLVIAAKTKENIDMAESRVLTDSVDSLINKFGFSSHAHILGRAYFQRELVDFQIREIIMAFIASLVLVTLIMILIYRRPIGILIALGSIALGLLLFTGYLGFTGTELNAISALFPVIMLIVGSSDVIHIFSKYVDELNHGRDKELAMQVTIKEIGMATFMTSFTTAIGFASLMTSRLQTISDFGWSAAIGVMIAYVTVIFFTTSLLSLYDKEKIIKENYHHSRWDAILGKIFFINDKKQKNIFTITILLMLVFIAGITQISTNYNIENNLPRGAKVTEDFKFFESNYAGFRPLEFAITSKTDEKADDFKILQEVDKLEEKVKSTGVIKSSLSLATIYRSINKMNHANSDSFYVFPESEEDFNASKKLIDNVISEESNILVNESKTKTRISARITDIGADKIKALGTELDHWVDTHIDTSLISVRRTGTGLILDKNAEYVTTNLLQGIVISILIIALLMGFLFGSFKMLIIALIPNLIPLFFAGAVLGYFGIELDAGVAIMFTIIFGIAVDDTIHFLTRFKICIASGLSQKEAIRKTIFETGKAIIFTSVILFFGFFTMIFSVNPPTFTVGILISVTLFSALICDLLLLPALIMRFIK